MNDQVAAPVEQAVETKPKTLANIVRGVIPHTLVYAIRFQHADAKDVDVAKMFGTTTGKVADIRKGRNFGYITEDFRPTAEQKEAALAWLKQVPDYDTVGTDTAVTEVERMDVASAEQAEAFLAGRRAARNVSPKEPKAEGEGADAPTKPAREKKAKAPKAAKPETPASDGELEDLLS